MKEKSIIPSLREKRRYLAYSIISNGKISQESARKAIEKSALSFLGQLEYARAGVMIMPAGNAGIIRASNKYLNKVRASMMFIDNIEDNPVLIETVTVSGILRKAKEALKENMIKTGGK